MVSHHEDGGVRKMRISEGNKGLSGVEGKKKREGHGWRWASQQPKRSPGAGVAMTRTDKMVLYN